MTRICPHVERDAEDQADSQAETSRDFVAPLSKIDLCYLLHLASRRKRGPVVLRPWLWPSLLVRLVPVLRSTHQTIQYLERISGQPLIAAIHKGKVERLADVSHLLTAYWCPSDLPICCRSKKCASDCSGLLPDWTRRATDCFLNRKLPFVRLDTTRAFGQLRSDEEKI